MKEVLTIGKEIFTLSETENGYILKEFRKNTPHKICKHGELNETIYRMIDRMCPAMI